MAVTVTPATKDLKWSHYTGNPPAGAPDDAYTKPKFTLGNTSLVKDGEQYKLSKVDIALTLDAVSCYVKPDKKSDALLEHERLHWIMHSLVAKEMEEALLAVRGKDPKELSTLASDKFDWYRLKRSKFLDDQYDTETNHSLEKIKQAAWATKIKDWETKGKIDLAGPT